MIHLVYVSSATREMSDGELMQMLEQARERNERQDVTGMLLYLGGNFIQVLEGEERDVDAIYDSIQRDKRNTGNVLIVKEPIAERVFPTWSMGFKRIDKRDALAVEGFSEFLVRPMDPAEFASHPDTVVTLLYRFKQNNA